MVTFVAGGRCHSLEVISAIEVPHVARYAVKKRGLD